MKKILKSNIGIIIVVFFVFCIILLFVILSVSRVVRESQRKMDCRNQMHGLYSSIIRYLDDKENKTPLPLYKTFPLYDSDRNTKYWSWRTSIMDYNEFSQRVHLNESWNSDYNLPIIQNYYMKKFFTCPGDYPYEENSSYVAVTGTGTVWTELEKGEIHYSRELENMILFIETSEPQKTWAASGDDVSPEEVIRLFEADPGLVKNSQKRLFHSYSHWPKHFITLGGVSYQFDTIKDIDALKKRLIIPNQKNKIRF